MNDTYRLRHKLLESKTSSHQDSVHGSGFRFVNYSCSA